MKIGVALPQTGEEASADGLTAVARAAEDAGLESLWVLERLLRPALPVTVSGAPAHPMTEMYRVVYSPLETLAYVAATTHTIQLGTSIIVTSFTSPPVLARRLATVDRLSGGRLIAGLGKGYIEDEFVAAGVPMAENSARFSEFISALRAVWRPDPVEHEGRFYRIPPSQIGPKPVRAGGPPILAAAKTPAAAARAGRLGLGLNPFVPSPWDALAAQVESHAEAAREVGVDRPPVVLRANTAVTAEPQTADRTVLHGSFEQVAGDLERIRELGVTSVFFDPYRHGVDVYQQIELYRALQERSSS